MVLGRMVGRLAMLVAVAVTASCKAPVQEITEQQRVRLSQVGNAAASALLQELVGRLSSALAQGGPAHALRYCSAEELPTTLAAQESLGQGIQLKRTTFRYRNPANAPDRHEEAALRHFEEEISAGRAVPTGYLQKAGTGEFRFYKPLLVSELCLTCHGSREDMDPKVVSLLGELYPEDLATGYAVGDFRGLIRVSIPQTLAERRGP